MIGLDTNVLVRYLIQDDLDQSSRASRLIETRCTRDSPGWVSLVVMCELAWALRGAYGYEKRQVVKALEEILATSELKVENEHAVRSALAAYRRGPADLADGVIAFCNHDAGCEATYSFDQKLVRHGFVLAP